MRLDVFFNDNGGFLVLVFLLVVEQAVDVFVPDYTVDQDLLEDCLFGSDCGRLGAKAGLESWWVDGLVMGEELCGGEAVGGGYLVLFLELDHIECRPDLLWHLSPIR